MNPEFHVMCQACGGRAHWDAMANGGLANQKSVICECDREGTGGLTVVPVGPWLFIWDERRG